MHQHRLVSFYNRILIVLLHILCNFENVESDSTALPTDCKAVQCHSPPEGFNCSLSRSINPKFLNRIGPLKDCCPSWRCTDVNDYKTRVLFMGLKGSDTKHYRFGNSSSGSSPPKGSSETCGDVHCPKLTSSSMSCSVDDKLDKKFQLLYKDYAHCCPTMYCQKGEQSPLKTRTFFVSGGTVPTDPEKIIQEKGVSSPGKTCSKISCAVKPVEMAFVKCEELPANAVLSRKEIKILGAFLECCPTVWQCTDPDESKYNVFEMAGESFWYYSNVLQESPDRSISNANANGGHCENVTCPAMKEDNNDACIAHNKSNSGIAKFVGNLLDCCPLYSCTDINGFNRISFNFIEGTIPETDHTKDGDLCDNFQCGSKPNYDNTMCWVTEDNSSIALSLGSLRGCCPVWKCENSDGTFYNKYKIMGEGFLYKEIQTAQKERVLPCKLNNDADKGKQDKNITIKAGAGKDTGDSSIKTDKSNENVQKEKGDDNSGRLHNGDGLKENPPNSRALASQNSTDSDNRSSTSTTNNKAATDLSTETGKKGDSDGKGKNGGTLIKKTDELDRTTRGRKDDHEFDPGYCDQSACIKPEDGTQCQVNLSHTVALPKPYINCCPSYTCVDSSSKRVYAYSTMLWGKIPPPQEGTAGKGNITSGTGNVVCSEAKCDQNTIEKDAICSKLTEIKSPASNHLGDYRDCCDMLSCTFPDGTTLRHFGKFIVVINTPCGMTSRSFRYIEIMQYTLSSESKTNGQANLTSSTNITTTYTNGTTEVVSQRECAKEEVCPRLELNGTCYEELSVEAMSYAPEKESCCPLIHCFSNGNKGPQHTQFVKYSGTIPTTTSDIEIQKGTPIINGAKCPKITCVEKPSFESVSCSPTTEGQPVMPQIKPFLDCCGMQRCTRQDGSFFIEFRIFGASFKYHETVFWNIKEWQGSNFYDQYKKFVQEPSWSHAGYHGNTVGSQWPGFGANPGMQSGFQPPLLKQHPHFAIPGVPAYGMPYKIQPINQPMYNVNPTGNGLHQQIVNRVNQQLANQNVLVPG